MRNHVHLLCSLLLGGVVACGENNNAGSDAATDHDGPSACLPAPITFDSVFIGPTGFETRARNFIAEATTSLDIQMYSFTVNSLEQEVIRAKNRGVDVRVILDTDNTANADAKSALEAAGVAVRSAPSLFEFSHAKYMIADGTKLWVSSGNFNAGAMSSERNYGFGASDTTTIEDAQKVFNADWSGTGGVSLPCTSLVLTPTNADGRVLAHIMSARSSLDLELFYLSDNDVMAAVVAAARAGVRVRAVLADADSQSGNAETRAEIEAAGGMVRYASGFDVHAKLILADGAALVGSQNMSHAGLNRNREMGAILPATTAAPIQAQFEADFSASR